MQFDSSQPIGFCIYCGESDPALLTDEHIAPEGLQGADELKKASCRECAKKTSYSELRILRGPLAALRERFGWYGKRRKDDRPETLTLRIRRRDWTFETIEVPAKDCPLAFRMPRFPEPRYLKPASANDFDPRLNAHFRKIDSEADQSFFEEILRADPGRERIELEMEIFELSKVLAKIAYCQSIRIFGPYAIRPFVTDIIVAERGQSPSFLEYVGGAFVEELPIEQLTTSHLGKCQVRIENIDDKFIVLARVQVIGPFDTPVYEVVVGELMARTAQSTIYVPTPIQPMKTYRELEIESMNLIMALKEQRMSINA